MRIFLLEDEYALNKSITKLLEMKGYNVHACLDGTEALERIRENIYNIYVVDINLPGTSGLDVLTAIKNTHPGIPVVIISSNLDITSISDAYNRGCDDYLKKPFHVKELEIKIERLLEKNSTVVQLNPLLSYNTENRGLRMGEKKVPLTKKENRLLDLLVQHLGKTVEFDQLLRELWGEKPVSKMALRTLVKRLRHKLEDEEVIQNIMGVGYRIDPPSERPGP